MPTDCDVKQKSEPIWVLFTQSELNPEHSFLENFCDFCIFKNPKNLIKLSYISFKPYAGILLDLFSFYQKNQSDLFLSSDTWPWAGKTTFATFATGQ